VVFWDGLHLWDNNNAMDWFIPVASCPPDAFFQLLNPSGFPWVVSVSHTRTGYVYDVQYSTNLASGLWTPFGFDVPGTGLSMDLPLSDQAEAIYFRTSVRPEN